MNNVSTEKAMNNQIASAEIEGFHFTKEALDIIRKYADREITHEELLRIVAKRCCGS